MSFLLSTGSTWSGAWEGDVAWCRGRHCPVSLGSGGLLLRFLDLGRFLVPILFPLRARGCNVLWPSSQKTAAFDFSGGEIVCTILSCHDLVVLLAMNLVGYCLLFWFYSTVAGAYMPLFNDCLSTLT